MSGREIPAWLDTAHPNYERWARSRELSEERGRFVKSVISKHTVCKNHRILDLGSGEGGTSIVLAENNFVISLDLSMERLKRQSLKNNLYGLIRGNAVSLPFIKNSFDIVILQDVIEHVPSPADLVAEIKNLLSPGGIVYLSTPNKLSVFNLLADPHWGMPLVSVLKRRTIRKYFLKYFRKSEYDRPDAAQLLSYHEIENLLSSGFDYYLNTRHSVERLFEGDKGIIWSDFHRKMIKILKFFRSEKLLYIIANDKAGIINKYFNPTFYLILKKKQADS